jgi:hypothetical protein
LRPSENNSFNILLPQASTLVPISKSLTCTWLFQTDMLHQVKGVVHNDFCNTLQKPARGTTSAGYYSA